MFPVPTPSPFPALSPGTARICLLLSTLLLSSCFRDLRGETAELKDKAKALDAQLRLINAELTGKKSKLENLNGGKVVELQMADVEKELETTLATITRGETLAKTARAATASLEAATAAYRKQFSQP